MNCEDTKKLLGKYWECCNTCHYDPYEREMGAFEHYTKFKGYSFEACCTFYPIGEKLTDDEWKDFEKKLEKMKREL